MAFLPDINVLIALAWKNHEHHTEAHNWFQRESSQGWGTCQFTQSGFLRLSLNPKVVGVAINFSTAIQLLESLVAQPDHQFIALAPTLANTEFQNLGRSISGYRQLSDATLLHNAIENQLRIVTFDQALATLDASARNVLVLPGSTV